MFTNSYQGVVQADIPRLIVSRARRHHLSPEEIDDLQQQIVPLLATFRFDPARANGAVLKTALTAVINQQIKAYLRSKHRYQQQVGRLQRMSGTPLVQDSVTSTQVVQPEAVDLRLDLERIMAQLSPRDREVCRGLSEGLTVAAIAERLKCGRDTVDRTVVRLRQVFAGAGLQAWVDPNCEAGTREDAGRKQ